ncbi:MAG: hypothetical protein ACE5QF_00065 [Thermoplasmata archaeon]
MIPKARLSDQKLYCSFCGTEVREEEISCSNCGSDFRDEIEADRCTSCLSLIRAGLDECPNCGTEVILLDGEPPREDEKLEEDFLRELVESTSLVDASHRIWELAEPFQRVIRLRRKKLEQMNSLLDSAQRRIAELENATNEVEMMERAELERQVAQLTEERNEILEIERGIIEMEKIYRNLLSLQETELKRKEDNLKLRLEVFRKEIERRDREKKRLLQWERTLKEKERTLHEKAEEVERRQEALEKRKRELEASERRIVEQLEANQAESGEARTAEGELSQLKDAADREHREEGNEKIASLESRIGDLESEMSRIVKAKEVLEQQALQLSDQNHEMKYVLKKLDALLGELPDNVIQEFAKSKDFKKYEKVIESCEG